MLRIHTKSTRYEKTSPITSLLKSTIVGVVGGAALLTALQLVRETRAVHDTPFVHPTKPNGR